MAPSSYQRITFGLSRARDLLWPAVLFLGLLLRLVVYLQNRSLFLDEANLARNIAEISLADCFAPLRYQQYAPPLFLVLEKINFLLAGASEYSLRFWPLIMGGLALLILYDLLRQLSEKSWAGLFVFYLFACSQVFIRYSAELKQYSTDMAVTSTLVWLALRYRPTTGKRIALWILAGSLAIWLSMPSVFVLTGVGLYFGYLGLKDQQNIPVAALLLIGTIWLLNFGLYFWLILANDLQKPDLLSYHQPYFWPLLPTSGADWARLSGLAQSLLGTLSGHTFPAIVLSLSGLVAGTIYLGKKRPALLWLLIGPIVACLIASGLGRYSLIERLTLFLMPLPGVLLAFGLNFLVQYVGRWGQLVLLIFGLLILPLRKGPEYLVYPFRYEEMRSLLAELREQLRAGDLLWIDLYAYPAFYWYTQHAPEAASLRPEQISGSVVHQWDGDPWEELSGQITADGRVWMIFSHLVSDRNRREMREDLESVSAQLGPVEREIRQTGVAAFGFAEERPATPEHQSPDRTH
ncbi:glycosyltransferase family 39 protein [Flavilitoribacter nigricans]|uniref:glycosyltransferase family 39 protein n=1 Tax=Flavilitoribacter nigricans TaxID=70997 RepID=UPI001472F9B9|nr:glycosyltransferase family 39 protein [Flavilitoribacter nigricans]